MEITNDYRAKYEYIKVCPYCGKELNSWCRGNFRGVYFNPKLKSMRTRYFCTEGCYKEYIKPFIVEVYNDKPIYCVEVDGEKRYMPYFEAPYYFTNIDVCRKRMESRVAYLPSIY